MWWRLHTQNPWGTNPKNYFRMTLDHANMRHIHIDEERRSEPNYQMSLRCEEERYFCKKLKREAIRFGRPLRFGEVIDDIYLMILFGAMYLATAMGAAFNFKPADLTTESLPSSGPFIFLMSFCWLYAAYLYYRFGHHNKRASEDTQKAR